MFSFISQPFIRQRPRDRHSARLPSAPSRSHQPRRPVLAICWAAFSHRLSSTAHWSRLDHNSFTHFHHLNRLWANFAKLSAT